MTRTFCLLLLVLIGSREVQGEDAAALATQARAVLDRHCLRCHGNAETDYFDVRQRNTLLAKAEHNDTAYVTPGKLDTSLLWEYVKDKSSSMPKSGEERVTFTDAQRNILKAWITAGAPAFPEESAREPVTLETMLSKIWEHAAARPATELPNLRYFTLVHLHNNDPRQVTAADLRITRAALAKALNSLSWSPEIVLPEEVPGTSGTVLAVNINKLGWGRDAWTALTRAYPYNVGFVNHDNERLHELDQRLAKLFANREPLIHLRADWFVATATRPPLYHLILFDSVLPDLLRRESDATQPGNAKRMTAGDLESFLGVDVIANLLAKDPPTLRAGFPTSGVSAQNRLIERHPLRGQGAYWKSYDFKSSTWEANLQQFPLGPRFKNNPFEPLAFKHDGGEIIFHLPNGLQGYLLVDSQDRRIDVGPIEVVSDSANNSGTPLVVNGISCIACHKNGMRPAPADQVRQGKGVFGEARNRVKALYSENKTFEEAMNRDQRLLFLPALERTIAPFLRIDEPRKRSPITDFVEPVSEVARRYYAAKNDLDAATVACELYLDRRQLVVDKASSSDVFRELGLGGLAVEGGKIKRGAWESVRGTSQMQQAAREFGYSPR